VIIILFYCQLAHILLHELEVESDIAHKKKRASIRFPGQVTTCF